MVESGSRLSSSDLTKIVSAAPQPLKVRDIKVLESSIDSAWLASDVKV